MMDLSTFHIPKIKKFTWLKTICNNIFIFYYCETFIIFIISNFFRNWKRVKVTIPTIIRATEEIEINKILLKINFFNGISIIVPIIYKKLPKTKKNFFAPFFCIYFPRNKEAINTPIGWALKINPIISSVIPLSCKIYNDVWAKIEKLVKLICVKKFANSN